MRFILDSDGQTTNWDFEEVAGYAGDPELDPPNGVLTVVGADVYLVQSQYSVTEESIVVGWTKVYHVGDTTTALTPDLWTLVASCGTNPDVDGLTILDYHNLYSGGSVNVTSNDNSVAVLGQLTEDLDGNPYGPELWQLEVSGATVVSSVFTLLPLSDIDPSGPLLDGEDAAELRFERLNTTGTLDNSGGIFTLTPFTGFKLVDEPDPPNDVTDAPAHNAGFPGYIVAYNPVTPDPTITAHFLVDPAGVPNAALLNYNGGPDDPATGTLNENFANNTGTGSNVVGGDFWLQENDPTWQWFWPPEFRPPGEVTVQMWLLNEFGTGSRVDDPDFPGKLFYRDVGVEGGPLADASQYAATYAADSIDIGFGPTPLRYFFTKVFIDGVEYNDVDFDHYSYWFTGVWRQTVDYPPISPYRFLSADGEDDEDTNLPDDVAGGTFKAGGDLGPRTDMHVPPQGFWSASSARYDDDDLSDLDRYTIMVHWSAYTTEPDGIITGLLGPSRVRFAGING